MNENCILIKTKDQRRFLTSKKNLPSLVEFAKTFGAEIFLADPAEGSKIFNLKALTAALCDPLYNDSPSYTKAQKIFPKNQKDRQAILADAKIIRQHIKNEFVSGVPVTLRDLKEKYKCFELTDACLCNHMSVVRKSLIAEGYNFRKVGAGSYCLSV